MRCMCVCMCQQAGVRDVRVCVHCVLLQYFSIGAEVCAVVEQDIGSSVCVREYIGYVCVCTLVSACCQA